MGGRSFILLIAFDACRLWHASLSFLTVIGLDSEESVSNVGGLAMNFGFGWS